MASEMTHHKCGWKRGDKGDFNQFNDRQRQKVNMKHKQRRSETHQQEHRFEFSRTARQMKLIAERCSRARVRFAALKRALAHCAPFCLESGLRRAAPAGTQSLALWNYSERAGFQPAMVLNSIVDITSLLMEAPE
jgi:hypothetical protein